MSNHWASLLTYQVLLGKRGHKNKSKLSEEMWVQKTNQKMKKCRTSEESCVKSGSLTEVELKNKEEMPNENGVPPMKNHVSKVTEWVSQ